MDEYYNKESYYEPSEFEIKINEFIKGEVEARIKQTVEDLESEKDKNSTISKELSEAKMELRKMKIEYDKNLVEALKEKELEVNRKFGLGFVVNDEVYYVKSEKTSAKCEQCNGKGKTEVEVLGKLAKVDCPHCSYGQIHTYTYFPKKGTITSMKFWVTRKDSWDKHSTGVVKEQNVEIYLRDNDYSTRPDSLYKTVEECQIECDKRNTEGDTND